jgi:hypothetical protein
MDYSLVVFMMHKEEGGGSPQTEVDIVVFRSREVIMWE